MTLAKTFRLSRERIYTIVVDISQRSLQRFCWLLALALALVLFAACCLRCRGVAA